MQKKNLVFEKFGVGNHRVRKPLPAGVLAVLKEKIANHKEWLRRGEFFKNNSNQKFK